ncbi:hypothetical protein [Bathymodiolus platifrons methanotrophic gill symbiont]|uniref:hypothetical protein n=1 Tax=Bathymodiolus platifrons methanotrophic gill symbiont TaxID=113268 RepID=UPI00142E3DF4|nr:hypothetical protein [Bathymodiolus platifrons methanotrophic gill symbiont]
MTRGHDYSRIVALCHCSHNAEEGQQARHATSQHSGTPVTNIHSPTQRMGDALVALRPSQLRTKPCSVKTTSNGWTAIRNAILASLARY